jgi:hypothetical protein
VLSARQLKRYNFYAHELMSLRLKSVFSIRGQSCATLQNIVFQLSLDFPSPEMYLNRKIIILVLHEDIPPLLVDE